MKTEDYWKQLAPNIEQLTTSDAHAVNNRTRVVGSEGTWGLVGFVWIGGHSSRWHSIRFPMRFESRDEAKAAATADPWIFYLWGLTHVNFAIPLERLPE